MLKFFTKWRGKSQNRSVLSTSHLQPEQSVFFPVTFFSLLSRDLSLSLSRGGRLQAGRPQAQPSCVAAASPRAPTPSRPKACLSFLLPSPLLQTDAHLMGLGGGRPGGSGPAMDPAAQLPPSGGAALDLVARRLFSAYPPRRGVTPPSSAEARLGERLVPPF